MSCSSAKLGKTWHEQITEPSVATSNSLDEELQRLPLELQLKIFSYFCPHQLTRTVAQVCKRWWILSQDLSLWTSLSLNLLSEGPNEACRTILSRCTALRNLTIVSKFPLGGFSTLFAKLTDLRKLNLSSCRIDSGDLVVIANSCRKIEILHLEDCKVDLKGIEQVVMLPNLHSMILTFGNNIDESCVNAISRRCQNLKVLRMGWSTRTVSEESICELLRTHSMTLNELDVSGQLITDATVREIARCTKLSSIGITLGYGITDHSLTCLATLQNLKELEMKGFDTLDPNTSLSAPNISKSALRVFFSNPYMKDLQKLSVCNMGIDDGIIRSITETSTGLKDIKFCCSEEITNEGLNFVVHGCKDLRRLFLASLPNLTGAFLNAMPDCLPHLEELCIVDCQNATNSSECQELGEKMPRLDLLLREQIGLEEDDVEDDDDEGDVLDEIEVHEEGDEDGGVLDDENAVDGDDNSGEVADEEFEDGKNGEREDRDDNNGDSNSNTGDVAEQ